MSDSDLHDYGSTLIMYLGAAYDQWHYHNGEPVEVDDARRLFNSVWEVIEERKEEVLGQIEEVRKARVNFVKLNEKTEDTPKKDKKKYRRARWKVMRAQVEVSRLIRKIEFTEPVKRRLIEEVKDIVERVSKQQREHDKIKKELNLKSRKPKLKEEERQAPKKF